MDVFASALTGFSQLPPPTAPIVSPGHSAHPVAAASPQLSPVGVAMMWGQVDPKDVNRRRIGAAAL